MKKDNIYKIIFDFDGVIAETDTGRIEILKKILLEYGIKLNMSDQKNIIGKSTYQFLKKNYPHLSETNISAIIKKRHNIYFNNLTKYCIPYPDSIETIYSLYDLGVKLYLATNNNKKNIIKLTKYLKINNKFIHIWGRETTENNATGIKNYSFLKKEFKNINSNIIVIEDSLIGLTAAKNENIFTVFYNPQFFKMDNSLFDYEINNYIQLKEFIIRKIDKKK